MKIIVRTLIIFSLALLNTTLFSQDASSDSLRILELNKMWSKVSESVKAGDFEGYKSTCHQDGVFVTTTGKNKKSVSLSGQLKKWESNFKETKAGKTKESVEFRFLQRIGDANTAHETGIFLYTKEVPGFQTKETYITHFEALVVKEYGEWKIMMEYQKYLGSIEEWNSLSK